MAELDHATGDGRRRAGGWHPPSAVAPQALVVEQARQPLGRGFLIAKTVSQVGLPAGLCWAIIVGPKSWMALRGWPWTQDNIATIASARRRVSD